MQLGIAQISGSRTRTFMFSSGQASQFQGLGGAHLGETGEQTYARAVSAMARFDAIVARTQKIANQVVRDGIISDYGLNEPDNKDKALYARNVVAYEVGRVDSFTPKNYLVFETGKGPAVGRVTKLENFNRDFASAVGDAEVEYGILPDPVVIERLVLVGGPSEIPIWVIPVVLVAAGVGIAAFFKWI